ncbi:MAG: UDP-N-acetylmuramoyl-tripeptide--D-alanyl-D-alanine ligase [Pyrinomonadaceae bacterium]
MAAKNQHTAFAVRRSHDMRQRVSSCRKRLRLMRSSKAAPARRGAGARFSGDDRHKRSSYQASGEDAAVRTITANKLMGARPMGLLMDEEITGFAIDSRAVEAGQLFFALSPEDYARHCFSGTTFTDAHAFIPQALERGAVAAVGRATRVLGDQELLKWRDCLLLADDVIDALQQLARGVLRAWDRQVIALGGSAGKTTTKDLTAHVLGEAGYRVLKSHKNYNNELGLPLSILQMESNNRRPEHFDVAVLEMGVSMPGEIKQLCSVAPPDIAVELCVAPEHLEFLGTLERVAEAEGEIIENIKPGGLAILNADDDLVIAMRHRHSGPVLTFGLERAADVTATQIESVRLGLTRFRLRTPLGEAAAELPLPGRHNLLNALAAAAIATALKVEPEPIARALGGTAPSEMRGEVLEFAAGFSVIDDTYNSNPRSLISAARSLGEGDGEAGRRIVVAGEMLELGPDSAEMHREAGTLLAALGVDLLWGVRGHAQHIIDGATEKEGLSLAQTHFFSDVRMAATALADEVRAGDVILVKGSRGVRMDVVMKALRERFDLKR